MRLEAALDKFWPNMASQQPVRFVIPLIYFERNIVEIALIV
jgi:hypothetical protein